MRKRVQRRKTQRIRTAVAKGDEPPDPITIAVATAAAASVAGTAAKTISDRKKKKKEAARQQHEALRQKQLMARAARQDKKPKLSSADKRETMIPKETLKPGQKVNAVFTSPQGVLGSASTGRASLLGG